MVTKQKDQEVQRAEVNVQNWPLDLIDDNPFNPRLYYKPGRVQERASSIERNGLLHKPKARVVEGRAQVAFGGYRRRAFLKLREKHKGKKFTTMPLEIEEISDEQMIVYALDENLNRDDNSPIEIARAVEGYFVHFPETTEVRMAEKMGMTQGTVSNFRRVLQLPKKVLDKIDEGRISFTMGRELLVLKGLSAGYQTEWDRTAKENVRKKVDDEYLMLEAIRNTRGPESADRYGQLQAPTVEGMQKAIHSVVSNHFFRLKKDDKSSWWSHKDPLFDWRAEGCDKCLKVVRTHPTKSETSPHCTDEKCWERKQKKHQEMVAAEAKKKQQEALQKLAAEQAQELQKAAISQEIPARLFRIRNRETNQFWSDGDIKSASPAEAVKKTGWDPAYCEVKEQTRGEHSTGWRKVLPEEFREAFAAVVDMPLTEEAVAAAEERFPEPEPKTYGVDLAGRSFDDKVRTAKRVRAMDESEPCKRCMRVMACDLTPRTFEDTPEGRVWHCDRQMTRETAPKIVEEAVVPVPEELKPFLEQAGTRGHVIDLAHLWADSYHGSLTGGYNRLSEDVLREVMDPDECRERCTKGFHFAFDSHDRQPATYYICSNKKCLTQKKAAFTRDRNAQNNAKKNAERAAFKEAVEATTDLDRARMKLILYAQVNGNHVTEHYSWQKSEHVTWLANRLKVDTAEHEREKIWAEIEKAVDKLSDVEMAQLVVNFMLSVLTYKGGGMSYYGADRSHTDYKIQTTRVLNWMGVGVSIKK